MATAIAKSKSKRVAAKKSVATAASPSKKRLKANSEKLSKAQVIAHLAERVELDKKTVKMLFDEMHLLVESCLVPRGYGEITLPIGIKIKRHERPATKARKGVNPFTGEAIVIKAKPKRKVIKVQAMKGLKDILEK